MLDSNAAMRKALRYEPPDEIFMTGRLQSFVKVVLTWFSLILSSKFQARARKVGVTPTMVAPSMLAAIANDMNMAEVRMVFYLKVLSLQTFTFSLS